MKKAQLRANLLDESSAFVTAPPKNQPHYPSKYQQNQGYPNQNITYPPPQQYSSYQPQHMYMSENANGNTNGYPQQQRPPQPYNQSQHQQSQSHQLHPPLNQQNQQHNQNYGYDYDQHHRVGSRSHTSYPSNSDSSYQNREGLNEHYHELQQQRGSYNGPYQQQEHQYREYNDSYQQQQYQEQQPIQQPRSHSYSSNKLPSQQVPQPRSHSQSYPQQEQQEDISSRKEPLRPKKQVFSLDDDSEDDEIYSNGNASYGSEHDNTKTRTRSRSRTKSNSSPAKSRNASIVANPTLMDNDMPVTSFNMSVNGKNQANALDQDKIQLLEEKIQRLERVLALQDLESKTSESSPKLTTQPVQPQPAQPAKPVQSVQSIATPSQQTGAPPLPPPPPPEKKSLLNSPKANLFLSGIESNNKTTDEMRLSASSLIPTERSLSDHSDVEDSNNDINDEEPPPSYEELENSGSLTYSQSIYRTGFEKAGYQMDHVTTPTNNVHPLSSEITLNNSKNSSKITRELMSKRKIPTQITDEMFEKAAMKASLSSIPTLNSETTSKSTIIQPPVKTSNQTSRQSHLISQVPPPAPVQNTIPPYPQPIQSELRQPTSNNTILSNIKIENSQSTMNQKKTRSTMDSSLYTSKTTNSDNINVIKYSTDLSYETLSNGIIKPILPSQSKESTEETIARFRKTRDHALSDYKQFTPKIQFYWAILLVETISKSEVLSKMTIDGKLRKSPISYKKLKKQRLMFLTTAIKVLEKLIQIAPNDTRARLYLGDIYSGGIHPGLIERDEKLGYQLFYDSAIKQNDPVACYRIACCLESGVGCKQDIEKSIVFFERGATLGDPSSMCQLGMMHFAGVNGCIQDISLSISYHKQAYETLRSRTVMGFDPLISSRSFQDARGALYTLAKLHQTDRQILCLTDNNDEKSRNTINELKIANVWCNSSKSLKYYLEAGKLGHNESQACLGYYYSQGFFPTHSFKSDKEANNGMPAALDPRKSIYWFSKAAADGHTYAALGLARWYGSGAIDNEGKIILKRDEQQAFLWGRKAADAGELSEAEFMIGICFEQGFGIDKNQIMAINYFERSARKGYKKAINKLKTLKR
ncbi:hypothetical protein C6P42_001937 [Pichia californica]|nr:hypothetical protein C6P42_001937 [[Candida] californica]